MRLAGRVAVVTGGSQGIGFATAQTLASEGAAVIALARDARNLEIAIDRVNPEIKERMAGIPTDVRNEVDVRNAIENILSTYGQIDLLINAAGVSMRDKQLFKDTEIAEWKRILDTNLTGTLLMCREVLPYMVEKNAGYIINILSTAAYRSTAGNSLYSASKFGARALTEAMIEENRRSGIRISSISPGPVDTNIWSHKTRLVTQEERATMLRAEEIADIVLFLATRPPGVHIENITVTPWHR